MSEARKKIAYTCSYAPLPLIHAAGFDPWRILPLGEAPDQAGALLHDNMCPHIKQVIDLALDEQVPDLAGMVIINSCDAMRRLADAWPQVRPDVPMIMIDLPVANSESARSYFGQQLETLRKTLEDWAGREVSERQIEESCTAWDDLHADLENLAGTLRSQTAGPVHLQRMYLATVQQPLAKAHEAVRQALETVQPSNEPTGVPIYLMGNVLPDPEALELFSQAGCRIVADELCTGTNQLTRINLNPSEPPLPQLAQALLERAPCARTFNPRQPAVLAAHTVARARAEGAQGVVAHVLKFCDPYLNRLPLIREALREEGLPFLLLEGDCTLRSLGQQRTRIEAFAEMIGG